jgi:hypothetical protein
VLGPCLLVALFELYWVLRGHDRLMEAIYIPGGLLAVSSAIVSAKLKLTPGGPPIGAAGGEKLIRPRQSRSSLELELARLRDERKVVAGTAGMDIKVRRIAYRDDAYDEINALSLNPPRESGRSFSVRWPGMLMVGLVTGVVVLPLTVLRLVHGVAGRGLAAGGLLWAVGPA